MSQPGFEGNYGGVYGGSYGPPSSQPYNNNFQNSYAGGNQGIGMENNEMQPPPPAGQMPSSSFNPQYSSADNWGSYASGAQVSSTQYRGPQPVQSNPYGGGGYSQSQGYNSGSDYGGAPPPGDQGQMEVDQGSMGQMDVSYPSYGGGGGFESETFDEERPLLEELGVDLNLIRLRTLSVLNPMQQMDAEALKDADLAGPLLFCLLFGAILLLTGKVHFGYIYGVGLLGCTSMYVVLNLMSSSSVSVGCVVSTLGYCLLPMVLLSSVSIVLHLQGLLGTVLSVLIIGWCSYSASKLFVTVLSMHSMQLLIAYPCALLYGVFALLTIF